MVRSCKIISLVLVVLSLMSAKREIDEDLYDEPHPHHVRHTKTQVHTQTYVSSLLQTDEDIQGAANSMPVETVGNDTWSTNFIDTTQTDDPSADPLADPLSPSSLLATEMINSTEARGKGKSKRKGACLGCGGIRLCDAFRADRTFETTEAGEVWKMKVACAKSNEMEWMEPKYQYKVTITSPTNVEWIFETGLIRPYVTEHGTEATFRVPLGLSPNRPENADENVFLGLESYEDLRWKLSSVNAHLKMMDRDEYIYADFQGLELWYSSTDDGSSIKPGKIYFHISEPS